MKPLEINKRMPFMSFNWGEHTARTALLTLEERGMFDVVRGALWTVVGCRMPIETLKVRLRIAPSSKEEGLLDTLLMLEILRRDDDLIYDEVQIHEFNAALAKAAVNQANGRKGGRPKSPPGSQSSQLGAAEGDF